MIGGVTLRMLPHLCGVLHLHVNRPWETSWPFDSLQKFQTDGASASNWLKICFIQLETLNRSWWWYIISMEFLQTFLRHWFFHHLLNVSGKPSRSKWNGIFWVVSAESCREQWNIWKVCPVCLNGIFSRACFNIACENIRFSSLFAARDVSKRP